MALTCKGGNSYIQNGNHVSESCPAFFQKVSMSDLAIPDHMGQLTEQSENRKIWAVVLDMLFCVFEDQFSEKPRDVIILPGCNIRPLVYKSAINGLQTNSQTVSGIAKFQFVIDDSSTSRKHVFGVESQNDLDTWYKVLKKAAALDPDITNDISTSNGQDPPTALTPRRLSLDEGVTISKTGYIPSQDSPNRQQKLNSPRSCENLDMSNNSDETASNSSRVNGHSSNQPSPRGTPNLVRSDSRRQSIQDFKKRLRREQPEPEVSKQQPIRAMHFEPKPSESTPELSMGKKTKSFGSFENLLKFKKKKRKSQSDESASNDNESMLSSSSLEQDISVSRSVDISASESKLGKRKTKEMSRSLEIEQPKNSSIVRRASDIKDRVFSGKRPTKPFAKLGDLHDCSINGFLHHKHHLKWQKLWCVVCRGCFYGFKSQSPDDIAHVTALLANCTVIFVTEKDKRQKHLYIFKLSQERAKSIYLFTDDYRELMKWLTVLQMESNSVISNYENIRRPSASESESISSSHSSQSSSVMTMSSGGSAAAPEVNENSRSRPKKKKKAPPKPPRHSSCPPPVSRDTESSTAEDTLTSGSMSSTSGEQLVYGSTGRSYLP